MTMLARKTKLLIVDDEPSTRLLLSQIFEGRGYAVAVANDGFAALEQMRIDTPDVILSSSGAFTGDQIPAGVAADAFYEKASGLMSLFEAFQIAEQLRPIESRNAVPLVPIWLPIEWQTVPGGLNHALSCPECLRIFAYTHKVIPGQLQEEICVFCESPIYFTVVKLIAAMSEREYHDELDGQLATQPKRTLTARVGQKASEAA
jgi:hypothetical protein